MWYAFYYNTTAVFGTENTLHGGKLKSCAGFHDTELLNVREPFQQVSII